MKVRFEEMFPAEFAEALSAAAIGYLPLGVLEWHGEHNAVGLDAIKAHAVCVRAAQRSGGIVVPALYWASDTREDLSDGQYLTGGVEHGERYHVPGSMFWIRPETFSSLLLDMYEAMRRRGFRAIVVVTGRWSGTGNLPAIRESGETFLARSPGMGWLMVTDQEVAPDLHYPPRACRRRRDVAPHGHPARPGRSHEDAGDGQVAAGQLRRPAGPPAPAGADAEQVHRRADRRGGRVE